MRPRSRSLARHIAALLSAVVLSALAGSARAQDEPPEFCATPRRAVESVFTWQQQGHTDLGKATRCLDGSGRSPTELEELARRIKAVFDARGIRLNPDDFSDRPDWTNPESGAHAFAPAPVLPDVVVLRGDDGKWRWTKQSLDTVSEIYTERLGALEGLVRRLPPSFRGSLFGVQVWQYLALLLLVVLGLVIRSIIAFVLENRLSKLASQFGTAWVGTVVDVFASPGATLAMAAILRVTYPELRLPIKAALVTSIAVRVLFVLSIVWAAYKFVDVIAAQMARKAEETDSKLDDQLVPLVRKALKVLVVIAGGLFILQNLDVDVGSLLAGLGIGGIAFALAARDTLANFFGSLMIFLDRPFQIGDWVKVNDVEGIVEEVGFRSTRIRTFYNSIVTVPNAKFTETAIDNLGERVYRRCFVTLNLTYDTTAEQMQAFVEGIRAIIQANEHTRKDYYEVHMSGFGAHSLDVMVYFFFKVQSWSDELRERHNVFLEIMRLAQELGVVFAFPTQTLHVDYLGAPGAPRNIPAPRPEGELAEVIHAFAPGGDKARPGGPKITEGYFAGTRRGGGDAGEG